MSEDKNLESSGSSTGTYYKVEARTYMWPKQIGDQIFTKEWSEVKFQKTKVPPGVPNFTHDVNASIQNVYNYEAANALRWWFKAELGYSQLETRLMSYELVSSYKLTKLEPYEEIDSLRFKPKDKNESK